MIFKLSVILLVAMVTTWSTIAAEDLPPVNEDNLDPDAAHVCQRTDKESYTQRISFKKYFTETTNTWCFAVPPRCTQYRIASRLAYRVETLYRDRVHYFCCNGYKPLLGINYCVPKCDDDCHADANQGYCVTPGNCKCNPGFSGTNCASGCANDRWGPNCTYTCNCGSKGSCDPYIGVCICQAGYTGEDCSQPCINSFGLRCAHPCVCENGATCDNVNGRCICPPGYHGAYCHKRCDSSTATEQGCEDTCPCQNNGVCDPVDPVNNDCICSPGYKGRYCTETCDRFHWGQNCAQNCSCNFGECDPVTGQCSCMMGYAGERCEIKCPDGFYGVGCLTPCGCKNGGKCYFDSQVQQIRCNCQNTGYHGDLCELRDCAPHQYISSYTAIGEPVCINCNCVWTTTDSCHPLNGSCSCTKGYHGKDCTDKCKMPFYGENCKQECQCKHGDCHHVTGQCSNCYPGYIGENCTKTCPAGTWGLNCANQCECMNNATCHTNTGYCDCAAGFYGLRCDKVCPVDKYGPHCVANCTCNSKTSECIPETGLCRCNSGFSGQYCQDVCPAGYYGLHCRQKCNCNEQTSRCDPQTGVCRCKSGWFGESCENRCHPMMWGPYCSKMCKCNSNGECDPNTGICQCYPGYNGNSCDLDSNGVSVVGMQTSKGVTNSNVGDNKVPLIVAVIVPCVILLVILAAVIYYFSRKLRRVKEENFNVSFQNGGDTIVPNGGPSIGVVNPTYEADNLRNERRYPHLSQRASVPPPLPHRLDSCASVDPDDVKLRVSMDDRCRPVSSQYAEVDDVEDRYTTLKSVNGKVIPQFDEDDDGWSSSSTTQSADGSNTDGHLGFENATYVEEVPTKNSSSSSHHSLNSNSNHGVDPIIMENTHQDHTDACMDHPITVENVHQDHSDACTEHFNDIDQTFVKNQASTDSDLTSGMTHQNIAANKNLDELLSSSQMRPTCENHYDIPHSGPVSGQLQDSTNFNPYENSAHSSTDQNSDRSPYQTPTSNHLTYRSEKGNNHYQTPSNSHYMIPKNNSSSNGDKNDHEFPELNDVTGTASTGELEFVDTDFDNIDPLESSLYDGSDDITLIKPDNECMGSSVA